MGTTEERMHILEMLDEGKITAEQASGLLAALETEDDENELDEIVEYDFDDIEEDEWEDDVSTPNASEPDPTEFSSQTAWAPPPEPAPQADPPDFDKWRRYWLIPLSIGMLITIFSALLLMNGIRNDWNGFWVFLCSWVPLLIGTIVLIMGWASRTAKWLHVRVKLPQDEWPRKIAISFPLPIKLAAWGLRTFGHFIPNFDASDLDKDILAFANSADKDNPIYIHVEETDGEQVQVYIG